MIAANGNSMRYSELLVILSEELSDLCATASSIQAALGNALEGATDAGRSSTGLWHVQEIDRVQQTMADLSAILRRAAEDEGPRIDVDHLLEVTRLGALRDRLRGAGGGSIARQKAGIVAIF
jgi:hypothetical protein